MRAPRQYKRTLSQSRFVPDGLLLESLSPPVEEFCILLVTGGPAVRIRGYLGAYTEPERAYLEHQDWFEPWVELPLAAEEEEILLNYCREFYYGE